jgi:hypothetical protein
MDNRIKLMDRISIERAMPFKRPLPPRSDDRGFYSATGWPPKPPTWRDHARDVACFIRDFLVLVGSLAAIAAAFMMWGAM